MSPFFRIAGAGLLWFCVGCGWGPPVNVSGNVTFNGKPLAMGNVMVLAHDAKIYTGEIGESGSYSIATVPSGPAKFAVISVNPALAHKPSKGELEAGRFKAEPQKVDPKKWFPIPQQFAVAEQAGLEFTVRADANTFDIKLTGDDPAKN